jgi:secondary thiamine-phosphate synthase enzyme
MITHLEKTLTKKNRGFHLITGEITHELVLPKEGLLNIFIKHTSAGLTINENCDPTVLTDLEKSFNHLVKEDEPFYDHTMEGSDDMPAHIKSTLVGSSLTIPIYDHKLMLGTWQGIYLCEFRNSASGREIVLSIYN